MAFQKILEFSNQVEAELLASILQERKIRHVIRQYANTALQGFFQNRFGWGWLEADEEDAAAIRETHADLRASAAGPQAEADRSDASEKD
ncbi:MAG: hypothetical protein JXD23_01720 [Spirochaetales bacterium]|nr:hypothetical protein [Spirochaetales bacterium]